MKGKQPYHHTQYYHTVEGWVRSRQEKEMKELRDKINDLELRLDKLITILYNKERYGDDYASRDVVTSTSFSGKNEFEDLLPNSPNNT